MIGSWASKFLNPVGVPSDYELDVDLPLVFPELPDDEDDEDGEDEDHLLPTAA